MSKLIKIINGSYGYMPTGENFVQLVTSKDDFIWVDNAEAERLVELRVARYPKTGENVDVTEYVNEVEVDEAVESAEPVENPPGIPSYSNLNTRAELDAFAAAVGIDTTGLANKSEVIAALDEYYGVK